MYVWCEAVTGTATEALEVIWRQTTLTSERPEFRPGQHRRLPQLTFGPERGDAGPRKPEPSLIDQVPRLPAGKELGIEAVQALDLEERIAERDELGERAFR